MFRPSRKLRKIVVDGVDYTWQVGAMSVIIRGPGNFKLVKSHSDATNGYFSQIDFEKNNASIQPHMIEQCIRNHVEKDRW